jgi:hypothetical protein
MVRRNAYLRESFHEKGLDAVRHAHQQFDQLASMPIPEALIAAKQLPEIFTEAIVIGYQDPQIAHDRLRSHFYINEVISLNDLVTQAKRKRFSQLFSRITLSIPRKLAPIGALFKGISKPIEAQSLSVEMDLMLNTIRAAHAPTAAKETSSLHPLSI